MRPRTVADVVRTIFDPGATALFIFGSIILSVLGNGVYDLARDRLGTAPSTTWKIVLGSLVIFVFTVFLLLLWWRTRKLPQQVLVSDERRSEPQPGLIVLVGPGDIDKTPEQPAILSHVEEVMLRYCWLIASPEAVKNGKTDQLERLVRTNSAEPYTIPIQDGYQARMAYKAVEEALDQARRLLGDLPLVVDITGGTKPMTAGAVLACRDYQVPVEYMLGKYNNVGVRDPRIGSQAVKVDLV
ncbi:MAG: hypothetical protein H0X37_07620 [Herpetosiphonaceae bacterium]|nr:hypothetical protein [Herpetosiphonaceae bacterium]